MDITLTEQDRRDLVDALIEAIDAYREAVGMEDYTEDDLAALDAKIARTEVLLTRLTSKDA